MSRRYYLDIIYSIITLLAEQLCYIIQFQGCLHSQTRKLTKFLSCTSEQCVNAYMLRRSSVQWIFAVTGVKLQMSATVLVAPRTGRSRSLCSYSSARVESMNLIGLSISTIFAILVMAVYRSLHAA